MHSDVHSDVHPDLAAEVDQGIERELTQLASIEIRQTRLGDTEILGGDYLRTPEPVDLPSDRVSAAPSDP